MIITTFLLIFLMLIYVVYYEVIAIKGFYFPFFTFVTLYYFIFHGIFPYYTASNVPHLPYNSHVGIGAALYTLSFISFQFAGYFLGSRSFRSIQRPVSGNSAAALKLVSSTLMVGYFVIHFVLQRYSVPSLPQLELPFWYFSISTLTFLLLRRELSMPRIVALVLAVLAKISIDLVDGLLTPILFSLLILLSAALSLKSYRTIIITSLICVSLFGSYGYIKYFSETVMKGKVLGIYEFTPEFSLHSLQASFNSMARRSSHLLLTGYVVEQTPALVPFEERNPIIDAVINHVPRVFWPSKPREGHGNAFGKRYGILNKDDNVTSWNLPWTVDLYVTLGPTLSVFSIFIIGGLFGVGVSWLSSREDQAFWFGVYSAVLFPLFYQESNFSLMTGSVFSVLIFLLVIYWVAKIILPQDKQA